ncbi:hypothetical protein HK102_001289 [Quaeritorhiza haematococci]|nr:hypothetical protein HK102_001289 [Quaeritorhiza haematococci]
MESSIVSTEVASLLQQTVATPALYVIKAGIAVDLILPVPSVPGASDIVSRLQNQLGATSAISTEPSQPQQQPQRTAPPAPAPAPCPQPQDQQQPRQAITTTSAPVPPPSSTSATPSETRSSTADTQSATAAAAPAPVTISDSTPAASSESASPAPVKINSRKAPSKSKESLIPEIPLPPPSLDKADIAVRMVDGETLRKRFDAKKTLGDVRNFIEEANGGIGPFNMAQIYPNRVYTPADEQKTLKAAIWSGAHSIVGRGDVATSGVAERRGPLGDESAVPGTLYRAPGRAAASPSSSSDRKGTDSEAVNAPAG